MSVFFSYSFFFSFFFGGGGALEVKLINPSPYIHTEKGIQDKEIKSIN